MRLLSVLLLMELSLLTLVLGLRLGLGDDDETIFLELPDLLLSEVSHLRLRVRAVALLLTLLLGGGSLLSILGPVLTFLSAFLTLSAVVPVLYSSVVVLTVLPVSVVALLVLSLLSWLFLSFGRLGLRSLGERSGLSLHCNNGGYFHLLSNCWSLHLHGLRLRSCDSSHGSEDWGRFRLSDNWCGCLGNHKRFGLYLHLLFQDVTDNLFLVADNGHNLVISVLLHKGSKSLLQFAVVGEVLE